MKLEDKKKLAYIAGCFIHRMKVFPLGSDRMGMLFILEKKTKSPGFCLFVLVII